MTTKTLATKLAHDFPQFQYVKANRSHWSPSSQTIFYANSSPDLLHELGHALLNHQDFTQDVELLQMERQAWQKACHLAKNYQINISREVVEQSLDNYRDWLHERSLCPACHQTGLQSRHSQKYHCLNCQAIWSANDARSCGLKRRLVK
jgi:hypothetical protein